ncbi:MAG: hypothetical protein LBQ27_02440, partial [Clostridiales bacterium]|nr:hypothetical protein [Clostridiales bacterium]
MRPKTEVKYSDKDNVKYMLKNWWNFDKKSFFLYFMRIPPLVAMPILTALIPKLMIEAIESGSSPGQLLFMVGMMSFLIALITWINPFLQSKCTAVAENVNTDYRIKAFRKMMNAGYEYIESVKGRLAFEKSKGFTQAWGSGLRGFFDSVVNLAVNITGLFTYTIILSVLDPALILIVFLCGVANFFAESVYLKYSKKAYDDYKGYHMQTGYIFGTANDYAAGKDVRIYGLKGFFGTVIKNMSAGVAKTAKRLFGISAGASTVQALLTLVCEASAFYYLLNGVLADEITVPNFLFYFSLVTGFFTWIFVLTGSIFGIRRISFNCGRYREFLDYEEDKGQSFEYLPIPKADEF